MQGRCLVLGGLLVGLVSCSIDHFSNLHLQHVFGTTDKEAVRAMQHAFLQPSLSLNSIDFQFNSKHYHFPLLPVSLTAPAFAHVERHGNESRLVTADTPELAKCAFRGEANNSDVVVVGCGDRMRALVRTEDGDYLLLQPSPVHSDQHVIHKRSTIEFQEHSMILENATTPGSVCAVEEDVLAFEESVQRDHIDFESGTLFDEHKRPLTVELGVFVDEQMWHRFHELYGRDADAELLGFVLATVNNIHLLYNHRSLDPKVSFVIVRYEVFKEPPHQLARRLHNSGDVDLLLDAFCNYQHSLNPSADDDPRHWDHALLFSGYDFYRGSLKTVAGYAPVRGMCSGERSCTINEGIDFGAVFVITHEMGHSLGMTHDGTRNACSESCCVMSPAVGAGKTEWSRCSNNELALFVAKLRYTAAQGNCLLDDPLEAAGFHLPPYLDHSQNQRLPGQRYTLHQQCRIFHGDCWHHELRDGQNADQVCEMVWCGAGEGVIRTSHPALEGSMCGDGRWCLEGRCLPVPEIQAVVVDGAWSAWNDAPAKECGGSVCRQCEVAGQLRVRRGVRFCESPAPNFGGRECVGSEYRATICSDSICHGPAPSDYANRRCTQLQRGSAISHLLSGQGFQYKQSPCRVWCHMSEKNLIRAVESFPDGTPCSDDGRNFCVKGQCKRLLCNGNALVDDSSECPPEKQVSSNLSQLRRQSSTGKGVERLSLDGWSPWSSWTRCSATCGGGIEKRFRHCGYGECSGMSMEGRPCNTLPCDAHWTVWGQWAGCEQPCSEGMRLRHRTCLGLHCTGSAIERHACPKCPSAPNRRALEDKDDGWTKWSSWLPCTASCGGGLQSRRRSCRRGFCFGKSVDTRKCNVRSCPVPRDMRVFTKRRLRAERRKPAVMFGAWSSWSGCSVACGYGLRQRKRVCQHSSCRGTVEKRPCLGDDCSNNLTVVRLENERVQYRSTSQWSAWSAWTPCPLDCVSTQRARISQRTCRGDLCFGKPLRFQRCPRPLGC